MKYAIAHILEGIRLHRQAEIRRTEDSIKETGAARAAAQDKARQGAADFRELVEDFALNLQGLSGLYRQGKETAVPGVQQLLKQMPTRFEVDRYTQQLTDLEARSVRLAAQAETADTQLEQFLRALQAGGESHITQNALKMSGYPDVRIDQYIIAHNEHRTANA